MRKIYIYHNFLTNSERNIANILQLATLLMREGHIPVVPLWYDQMSTDEAQANLVRLELLRECHGVLWLDEPSEALNQVCVELGIVTHKVE
jgi:hypothetical protein